MVGNGFTGGRWADMVFPLPPPLIGQGETFIVLYMQLIIRCTFGIDTVQYVQKYVFILLNEFTNTKK
jgi:hypothetical protein